MVIPIKNSFALRRVVNLAKEMKTDATHWKEKDKELQTRNGKASQREGWQGFDNENHGQVRLTWSHLRLL